MRIEWAGMAASAATALALIACFTRPASKPPTGQVNELFSRWNRPDSPGCALGVSRDGVAYERGYGAANLDLAVPMTPVSVFDVASVSKQFTAMSVLLLAGQGKLSLDDDVGTFIPGRSPRPGSCASRTVAGISIPAATQPAQSSLARCH
jgi:CubicO group peptidase (beta-lactamase class C family)